MRLLPEGCRLAIAATPSTYSFLVPLNTFACPTKHRLRCVDVKWADLRTLQVNKGPHSAAVVAEAHRLGALAVRGNHDDAALAAYADHKSGRPKKVDSRWTRDSPGIHVIHSNTHLRNACTCATAVHTCFTHTATWVALTCAAHALVGQALLGGRPDGGGCSVAGTPALHTAAAGHNIGRPRRDGPRCTDACNTHEGLTAMSC